MNTPGGRTCSDCPDGYEGTGEEGCEPIDPCDGVTCGRNATCVLGTCQCLVGYTGDPETQCDPGDLCDDIICGFNAQCLDGECQCKPGFSGDPEPDGEGCYLDP